MAVSPVTLLPSVNAAKGKGQRSQTTYRTPQPSAFIT
jgi:hypothetical protein